MFEVRPLAQRSAFIPTIGGRRMRLVNDYRRLKRLAHMPNIGANRPARSYVVRRRFALPEVLYTIRHRLIQPRVAWAQSIGNADADARDYLI